MTDIFAEVLGAVGAATGVVGAATGAIGLVFSRRSIRVAQEANDNALASDRRARLIMLTPHIEVTWLEPWGADNDHARIEVKLAGPNGLDRLDSIEIFVRDDQERDVGQRYMDGPTQEDINKQVWGPYRFQPRADGATGDGRRLPAFDLNRGSSRKLAMERTQKPRWQSDQDSWLRQYKDHPVRLMFVCGAASGDRWKVPVDVVRQDGQVTRSWTD